MLQKSLSYTNNKFWSFYRVPEKIIIFKKIENYKIWAMNLSSVCLSKTFFDHKFWLSKQKWKKKLGFCCIV